MTRLVLVIYFLLCPTVLVADTDKYKYCEILGTASGVDDSFIEALAFHSTVETQVIAESNCDAIMLAAHKDGQLDASGLKVRDPEAFYKRMRYQNFKNYVYDQIFDFLGEKSWD